MSRWIVAPLVLFGLALGGCRPVMATLDQHASRQGRYAGIGIYGPGRQWTRLVLAERSKDPALAQLVDDQVVIVVHDSISGEVRACGDLSGYCVSMNPWKAALTPGQNAPVKLSAHENPVDPDITIEVGPKPSRKHRRAKPAGEDRS